MKNIDRIVLGVMLLLFACVSVFALWQVWWLGAGLEVLSEDAASVGVDGGVKGLIDSAVRHGNAVLLSVYGLVGLMGLSVFWHIVRVVAERPSPRKS